MNSSRRSCGGGDGGDRAGEENRTRLAMAVEAPSSRLAVAPAAARVQTTARGSTLALVFALAALLCASLLPAGVEGMASNEADDSNNLGLLAQACADSFCGVGVNALDLWLSLEETCSIGPSAQPYLDGLLKNVPAYPQTALTATAASTEGWSPTAAAVVCVGVWSLSVYAGFRSGIRVGTQTKGGYPVA